jgi:hypothetical protein
MPICYLKPRIQSDSESASRCSELPRIERRFKGQGYYTRAATVFQPCYDHDLPWQTPIELMIVWLLLTNKMKSKLPYVFASPCLRCQSKWGSPTSPSLSICGSSESLATVPDLLQTAVGGADAFESSMLASRWIGCFAFRFRIKARCASAMEPSSR